MFGTFNGRRLSVSTWDILAPGRHRILKLRSSTSSHHLVACGDIKSFFEKAVRKYSLKSLSVYATGIMSNFLTSCVVFLLLYAEYCTEPNILALVCSYVCSPGSRTASTGLVVITFLTVLTALCYCGPQHHEMLFRSRRVGGSIILAYFF